MSISRRLNFGSWEEYFSTRDKRRGGDGTARSKLTQHDWQPPATGTIKIDIDCAMDKQSGKAGVGVVARDSEGKVVGAVMHAHSVNGILSPRVIAALGFRLALTTAVAWNLTNIVVEGNGKTNGSSFGWQGDVCGL